jgi:hypothetical protein
LKELTRRGREFIFEARAKGSERQWLWQNRMRGSCAGETVLASGIDLGLDSMLYGYGVSRQELG